MSANMKLEPGIKALVIGYAVTPDNLGKVVTLVKLVRKGDISPNGIKASSDLWWVEGEDLSQVMINILTGKLHSLTKGHTHTHVSGKYLMPIRPEEDPLEFEVEKSNAALA